MRLGAGVEAGSVDATAPGCSICGRRVYRDGLCRRCWEYELAGEP